MKYKAIIFDLFGVVVNEIGIAWLKKNFPLEQALEIEGRYGPLVDTEEITEEEYFNIIGDLAKQNKEDVQQEWYNLVQVNTEVVALIRELKKQRYKICLLSNAYRKLFNYIIYENNLAELFDEVVTSFETKVIKPDPEIFRAALNQMRLDAREVIFIDDREKNAKAGEVLGIKSILFKDVETLKVDLEKLGVK